MTCHFVLPFSEYLWGDEVTMQVLERQKEFSKMQRLGQQMINGQAIWKRGISEIAKVSRNIAPEPHKTGLQHPI